MNGIWYQIHDIRGTATIDSPEQLWALAIQYFQWCEENPLLEGQLVKFPLKTEIVAVPKQRAMSMDMFFVKANITPEAYAEAKALPEFKQVCRIIESIIYDQKLGGAAAGLLKEGIIVRDLGLGDKVDHTSSDGSMGPSHITIEAAQ